MILWRLLRSIVLLDGRDGARGIGMWIRGSLGGGGGIGGGLGDGDGDGLGMDLDMDMDIKGAWCVGIRDDHGAFWEL